MADSLYIKTADGPVKVEIEGGSGGVSHKVFTSTPWATRSMSELALWARAK